MELVETNKISDGEQRVYSHHSSICHCDMRFAVFLPQGALASGAESLPTLFWLSGLTCTEQNFITKAGVQRYASEHQCIVVAPDTSPRGDEVHDDPDKYDFGKGAGFYCDATEDPWSTHYNMYSYIVDELYALVCESFPVDRSRIGIFGHSMGGHGALTIHLKNPDKFKTVSAFAPIVAPCQVPWGQKALRRYLGDNESSWKSYDACELVKAAASAATILIEQGMADSFLEEQLKPELFEAACSASGQSLVVNRREGYDHSYYFMASFIGAHIEHHLSQFEQI